LLLSLFALPPLLNQTKIISESLNLSDAFNNHNNIITVYISRVDKSHSNQGTANNNNNNDDDDDDYNDDDDDDNTDDAVPIGSMLSSFTLKPVSIFV